MSTPLEYVATSDT